MRNIVSIALIGLFLLTFFKPIMPYVDYALRYDYISQVLCINKEKPQTTCKGKCYLEKQIKNSSKKKSETPQSHKNKLLCFPLFIEKTTRVEFSLLAENIIYREVYSKNGSKGFENKVFHPPNFV